MIRLKLSLCALMVSATFAWGQPADPEQIKALEADLCATKATAGEKVTEGAFCPECEIEAVSPTPKKLLPDELSDAERLEIAFLERYDQLPDVEKYTIAFAADQVEQFEREIRTAEERLLNANKILSLLGEAPDKTPTWPHKFKAALTDSIRPWMEEIGRMKAILAMAKATNIESQIKDYEERLRRNTEMLNDLLNLQSKLMVGNPGAAWSARVLLDQKSRQAAQKVMSQVKIDAEGVIQALKESLKWNDQQTQLMKRSYAADSKLKTLPPGLTRARLELLRERANAMTDIARRSNPNRMNCGLTKGEELALIRYSISDYKEINSAMRNGGDALKLRAEHIALINSGLKKLKPFKGKVRRGANLPADVLAQHQPGQVVEYKAFSSTSLGSGFGYGHQFVIHSKSGRYIAPFSAAMGEYEVLIPPAKFKVISRTELAGNKIEFVMEELE